MKKFLVLLLGLSLTAASCNTLGIFDLGSGTKGIFRSDNAGESYSAGNQLSPKGQIGGLSVYSLAFDPSNPAVIYLAGANGIYKTDDYGNNWKFILSNITAADITIDPNNPQTVYASGIVGTNGKIVKSPDGGASWVDIYTEPSKNNTVLTIAAAPDSSVVLAGLYNGEVIRSFDQGRTWQAVTDLADRVMQIRYNGTTPYALAFHKGLYKSGDNGLTWNAISPDVSHGIFSNAKTAPVTASTFYNMALDKKQPGVIYLGTEQGLLRTVNDGADWAFVSLPVKDTTLRTSAVAVDPGDSNTLYATVGSTVFKSTNGGLTWQTKELSTTNEVRTIIINPASTNILYLGVATPRK